MTDNNNSMNISTIATEQMMLLIDYYQSSLNQALQRTRNALCVRFDREKNVADSLETHFGRLMSNHFTTELISGMYNTFIEQVDWQIVAEHYIQKVKEGESA